MVGQVRPCHNQCIERSDNMNEILNAISVVGFPIVMCGVLCYYIFKTQTALISAINNNSMEIAKLIERMEDSEHE